MANSLFSAEISERNLKTNPVSGSFFVIQTEPAVSFFISTPIPNPTLGPVLGNPNFLPKVSFLPAGKIDWDRICGEPEFSGIHGLIVNAVSGFRRYDAGNRVLLCQSN